MACDEASHLRVDCNLQVPRNKDGVIDFLNLRTDRQDVDGLFGLPVRDSHSSAEVHDLDPDAEFFLNFHNQVEQHLGQKRIIGSVHTAGCRHAVKPEMLHILLFQY